MRLEQNEGCRLDCRAGVVSPRGRAPLLGGVCVEPRGPSGGIHVPRAVRSLLPGGPASGVFARMVCVGVGWTVSWAPAAVCPLALRRSPGAGCPVSGTPQHFPSCHVEQVQVCAEPDTHTWRGGARSTHAPSGAPGWAPRGPLGSVSFPLRVCQEHPCGCGGSLPPRDVCGRRSKTGLGDLLPPRGALWGAPARLGGCVSRSSVPLTPSVLVLCWLGRPRPVWGSVDCTLGCGEGGPVSRGARGDRHAVGFQYKVLSVLPGSGMGIAVSTPSTQKVSAGRGPGRRRRRRGAGRGSERRSARLAAGQRGLGSPLPPWAGGCRPAQVLGGGGGGGSVWTWPRVDTPPVLPLPASRWCSAPWCTETRRSRPSSAST